MPLSPPAARTDPLLHCAQERVLAWMRAVGAVIGIPVVATFQPPWPDGPRAVPLALVAVLGVIGLIGVVRSRDCDPRTIGTVRAWTMAADAGFLLAFSLVHASQEYSIAHALLLVLPLEGAIKYGRRGALAMGGLVVAESVPRQLLRVGVFDQPFALESAAFVAIPAAIITAGAVILESTARREAVRAQMHAEAETIARRELESLNQVILRGVGELGASNLRSLASDIARAMQVEALVILRVDESGTTDPVSVHGGDPARIPRRPDPDRVLMQALRGRETHIVYADELTAGRTLLPDAQQAAVIPLRGSQATIGALVVESSVEGAIDRTIVAQLERVGRQVALLLDAQRAFAEQSQLAEHYRRLDQLRDDFLSIASHEIRTPLTSLLGTTETLHRRGDAIDPEARRELVEGMHRNTRRLLRLLRDLELARAIDRDEVGTVRTRIELDTFLHDYRSRAQGRGVGFVGPDGIECAADPDHLAEVLDRLLDNARRHAAGAAVTVSWGQDHGPWIRVSDLGRGIPASHRDAVFQRFRTVAGPLAHQQGAGLGLPLARDLCRLMGGELELEDVDVGTSVLVRLPRATARAPLTTGRG